MKRFVRCLSDAAARTVAALLLAALALAALPTAASAASRGALVDLPGLSPHWETAAALVTLKQGGLKLPDPERDILVIFTHGSSGASHDDWCKRPEQPRHRAMSVPRVLTRLNKQDDRIHVLIYCTRARPERAGIELAKDRMRAFLCARENGQICRTPDQAADLGLLPCGFRENTPPDPRRHQDPEEQVKPCLIAAELMLLVPWMQRENPGLTRDRIFLAGTSNGAWSSLFALQGDPGLANAVVGFAPASVGQFARITRSLAGRIDDEELSLYRGPLVSGRRKKIRPGHVLWLGESGVRALLFAFVKDPFETPRTLAVLRRNANAEIIEVLPGDRAAKACTSLFDRTAAHSCNHSKWFRTTYGPRILSFIRCRVDDPQAACRP